MQFTNDPSATIALFLSMSLSAIVLRVYVIQLYVTPRFPRSYCSQLVGGVKTLLLRVTVSRKLLSSSSYAIHLRPLFLRVILLRWSISSNASEDGIVFAPADTASPLRLQQGDQETPIDHRQFQEYAKGFPLPKVHLSA